MSKIKILYGINGTGQGHLALAKELLPRLQKVCEVDLLISGKKFDLDFAFAFKYDFRGLTFYFDKKGNLSYLKSLFKNNLIQFLEDAFSLNLAQYDLILSDFEPITAWASKIQKKKSLQLSRQASIYSAKTPRPNKKNGLAEFFMRLYCPCRDYIGFNYDRYDQNIFYPVIKNKVLNCQPQQKDYYVVYFWNYQLSDLLQPLLACKDYQFKIFYPKIKQKYTQENCQIHPTADDVFFKALKDCSGIICSAGFALTSEALYLGKKMLLIPQKNQYEQECNAVALAHWGIASTNTWPPKNLKDWLQSKNSVKRKFHTKPAAVLQEIQKRF